ncbi:MAG TPA: XdhC/CoxI family protein [Steroidobacteraceae bacterium]|nr:XdhC/CoxI family protein [Steroidobacteraceae bacterium]
MEAVLDPLLPLFERERAAGRALALGVLVHTAGSTYRKPGALILIAVNGEYAGLISGGCLEGDLREHALTVIESGTARVVSYDMRGGEDLLWGLGLGCEGAMRILLLRVGPENGWQPLAHLAAALASHHATAIGVVVESAVADLPPGTIALPESRAPEALAVAQEHLARVATAGQSCWLEQPSWKLFVLPLWLPPRILLLGAGPDALPVVDLAARLNWRVTLADHRAAYAVAAHFPSAERVVLARPEELPAVLALGGFSAAVVMSHHLPSDLAYLRVLAATSIPYVGLLGPAVRRERLLAELGADAGRLRGRLHAPVGLALGGRTPESIALGMVAQIHAFVFKAL